MANKKDIAIVSLSFCAGILFLAGTLLPYNGMPFTKDISKIASTIGLVIGILLGIFGFSMLILQKVNSKKP